MEGQPSPIAEKAYHQGLLPGLWCFWMFQGEFASLSPLIVNITCIFQLLNSSPINASDHFISFFFLALIFLPLFF